ncbi:MAG: prefoldin subunit alpha [archaeon]|nr:prefoldin subunit alpha [archaeon]
MASSRSSGPSPGGKPIPLTSLNIEDLSRIKGKIEEELQVSASRCRALEGFINNLSGSKSCLLALGPGSLDKEIMVPLTSSLYVAGKIDSADRVLVDLGTHYYMEASVPEVANQLNRQIKEVQESLTAASEHTQTKAKQREAVVMVMQQKIAEAAKVTAPQGAASSQ